MNMAEETNLFQVDRRGQQQGGHVVGQREVPIKELPEASLIPQDAAQCKTCQKRDTG